MPLQHSRRQVLTIQLVAIAATAAAVAAASAAATAAVTAATAATATITAAAAIFARFRFVDVQAATVDFLAVKLGNGCLAFFFARHFDEAEAARTSRLAVFDDRR